MVAWKQRSTHPSGVGAQPCSDRSIYTATDTLPQNIPPTDATVSADTFGLADAIGRYIRRYIHALALGYAVAIAQCCAVA